MAESSPCRVLVLGAHPDDAEVFAGGLVARHCNVGSIVRVVSVTDGRSGHHEIAPEELVAVRRQEAAAAAVAVGAESYKTLDFHDGSLQPDLEVRAALIREIRSFEPDLVLTHRPNDYHPDHRAVGTVVQDASYMVTVPHCCPDTPALRRDPVVAYMCDLFTRPNPMRLDAVLDVSAELATLVSMAACHKSQFFEWLPWHDGIIDTVPDGDEQRRDWLANWFRDIYKTRYQHFLPRIEDRGIQVASDALIEVFEISEYAGKLDRETHARLFPGALH